MNIKEEYDVIVIGAGVGGLTCGALLAKEGLSVLVAEQHSKPGGYCTSFRRKGFTFDAGCDFLMGAERGAFRMGADIQYHKAASSFGLFDSAAVSATMETSPKKGGHLSLMY